MRRWLRFEVVMEDKATEKKERLLSELDKGMVMVHLDARRPGVLVPPSFKDEAHLRLNMSYRFDPPDLSVGEWGVRSTLSFSGSRFTVALPWSAIFAVQSYVTKELWLYPEDLPEELLKGALVTDKVPAEVTDSPAPAKLRPVSFEVVSGAKPPLPASAQESTEEPPKPASRGHLRLVK